MFKCVWDTAPPRPSQPLTPSNQSTNQPNQPNQPNQQFIGWLSKLRRQYGKIFRIFTGNRAYIVLMDKVVRVCVLRRGGPLTAPHQRTRTDPYPNARFHVTLIPNQAAREALSDPRTFVKGPDYKEKFSFVFGDGLVTSVGEKHKADRALFAKYFTQKKIETHLPVLCKQTLAAIEAVRATRRR